MKVVLDTNVILSALLFGGTTAQIHALWKAKTISPYANRSMMREYAKVLTYKKFKLTENEIAAIFNEEIFPFFSIIKTSSKKIPHLPTDPDDIPFLQAAIDGQVSMLITGDPHLIDLKGKYAFSILSPADFLDTILL